MVVQCSEDAKAALNQSPFERKLEAHLFTRLRLFGLYTLPSQAQLSQNELFSP